MNRVTSKKVCIYLDQFAITDLMESKEGDIWFDIKKLLINGYEKGKLFCPLSSEHYIETSKKDYHFAKEHDNFFSKLSDQYCIKPEVYITSQLISSRIRKNNITLKTFMYNNINLVFDKPDNYERFLKVNNEHNYLISESTSALSEIRRNNNNSKFEKEVLQQLFDTTKRLSAKRFVKRLKYLEKKKHIITRGDQIGNKEVPNWIDLLIEILLRRHKLRLKEIKKLINEFEKFGFDNIPTLDIRTTLEAYAAIHNRKTSPNDQIDFMRIINGLPISDIFLTDKKRKYEITETGLDKKYKTSIFSGTESDLKDLEKELKLHTIG